jgi:phosphotransferase system  glucose/maltose/N-acetylglucosamine-specific IIC component
VIGAQIETQVWLFGGAGLVSLAAFIGLILVPALGSFGRIWEKAAAAFLSLFVLATLVLVGIAVGIVIVYYYPEISEVFGGK